MRIGRKLAVTNVLMSLLLVGLVLSAKMVIDRVERDFDTLHNEFSTKIGTLNNLRAAALRIVSSTNEFAFIVSIRANETVSADVVFETGGGGDRYTDEDQLVELKYGIEAFDRSFDLYAGSINEHSPEAARYRDDIASAGKALIAKNRQFTERVAGSAIEADFLEIKELMESVETSYSHTIEGTFDNRHEAFEVRKNELNEITRLAGNLTSAGSSCTERQVHGVGHIGHRHG